MTALQVNLPLPAGCTLLSASTECQNTLLLNLQDDSLSLVSGYFLR